MRDIWAEGKWVDMWSLVHFMSGLFCGVILYLLGTSLSTSIIITSVLFFVWEVAETFFAWEHFTNQVADIIIDYSGYGVFYLFYYVWSKPFSVPVLVVLVAIFLALEFFGIRAAIRRKKNK